MKSIGARVLTTEWREIETLSKKIVIPMSSLMLLAADLLCVRKTFSPEEGYPVLSHGSAANGQELAFIPGRLWSYHYYTIADLIRESSRPDRSMSFVMRYELLNLIRTVPAKDIQARFSDHPPDAPPRPKYKFSTISHIMED